jgi:hypothetical protein
MSVQTRLVVSLNWLDCIGIEYSKSWLRRRKEQQVKGGPKMMAISRAQSFT